MRFFSIAILLLSCLSCQEKKNEGIQWQEGYLDIHHLNTGRGDAAFFVFPDGTTMLFDAGEAKNNKKKNYYLKPFGDSISTGTLISKYIEKALPKNIEKKIDYAVISHFHSDHYGAVDSTNEYSKSKRYRLSGITEVGSLIPIKSLIDRGYPKYDYPVDLRTKNGKNSTFSNYLDFIEESKILYETKPSDLEVGSSNQICLLNNAKKYPAFKVLNIKSNEWIWNTATDAVESFKFDPPLVNEKGYYSENTLSIVLKIEYGAFDYYTGGDLPGFYNDKGDDYDIETTVGESVGEVDVFSLNHHGYFDATNMNFIKQLDAQVAVQQSIHDPHFQDGVLKRLKSHGLGLYAVAMSDSIKIQKKDLIDGLYKSTNGHVLIRVLPSGNQFKVLIVDDKSLEFNVIQEFGPFKSK